MTHKVSRRRGFTMIELMLAMSFVSVLMLAIAFLTIYVMGLYNKGITLREVDQTGSAITQDLQRTIGQTSPFNVDNESVYVSLANRGGRLCTGKYSYAWNYANTVGSNPTQSPYTTYVGTNTPVRFARMLDPSGTICQNPTNAVLVSSKTTELLSGGERDLVLYDFSIYGNAANATSSQAMYTISFTLGTQDQGHVDAVNKTCKPPADADGLENYCSINQFDIIARAGNREAAQ